MGMAYSTRFTGVLEFSPLATLTEMREVSKYLGVRTPDNSTDWSVIGLRFTKGLTGLEWNGDFAFATETSKAVLWLISQVRKKFSHFTLKGTLVAQGDAPEDRWKIVCDESSVCRIDDPPPGFKVECPVCKNKFRAIIPEERE